MNITRSIRSLFGRKPAKLNCWPGCVALTVDDGTPESRLLSGRTVTVTHWERNHVGDPAWFYEGPQICIFVAGIIPLAVDCIPDTMLRPITPPAGEVTDSEVTSLYTDTPVKEAV